MTIKEDNNINIKRFSSGDYLAEEEAQTIIKESEKILRTEMDAYAEKAEKITDNPDNDILKMAKAIDISRNTKAGKSESTSEAPRTGHRLNRLSHYAAVFIACLLVVGTVGAATSDAFRTKLFNVFLSEESDSVTLESVPDDSPMKDWSDYWYPEYLPEGFKFTSAEESDFEKTIRFDSINSDKSIIISIRNSEGSTASYNTDGTEYGNISIGEYEGYYFTNGEDGSCIVTWLAEEQTIRMVSQYVDKDEIIKVAESMVYVK